MTPFTEIGIGTTLNANKVGTEVNFKGYIKDFRWWDSFRSQFKVKYFENIYFNPIPSDLISYWRLNEPNDGSITLLTDLG